MATCLAWRHGGWRTWPRHGGGFPILLRVLASVHWLSVAPLLESLDLRPWLGRGVDWIVVGSETGAKNARYMDPNWARDLRDQCRDTSVALFLKQMSKRRPIPADLMVREHPFARKLNASTVPARMT